MSIHVIASDLRPIEIELDSIFLDPNNPRFVGADWTRVPDEDIADSARQQAARARLIDDFAVDRLRRNMEVNGFLPIDRVIVRAIPENKYVVLEGNRRICAAKLISDYSTEGEEIPTDVKATLKRIPCLLYTGTDHDAAWLFQGIRHITGFVDWSSFNKAKLLVEQMERESIGLAEVGKRFGVSAQGAGQWRRGYKAFEQATEHPDYADVVDERAYPFFMEIFSRSSMVFREWLEWDDQTYSFRNELNFQEFLSWMYPSPSEEEVAEGVEAAPNWDRRKITKRDDIRSISYLIREAKPFFEQFRHDLDLDRAYSEARAKKYQEQADPANDAIQAVAACQRALLKWTPSAGPT